MGWSQLVIDSFVVKECEKCTGCFIVKLLEVDMEATGGEDLVGAFIRLQDLVSCPRWHGFGMHIVSAKVIQHKNIVVAYSGGVR